LRAEVSIASHTILLIELRRLPIVEADDVRLCTHERNTCADNHGNDELNESIPHDGDGNRGCHEILSEEKGKASDGKVDCSIQS
jgi:hypothetical protein